VESHQGKVAAKPKIHDAAGAVRVGETVAGPLELPLADARVTQVRSDHAFSLVLDEEPPGRQWIVRVEGPFSLADGEHRTATFGENARPSAWGEAIDALLHATLVTGSVAPDGTLTLSFDRGQRMEVLPQEQWEAWQVTGPGEVLVVCGPGGQLSRWPTQHAQEAS